MGSNEVTSEARYVLESKEPPFHHPRLNVKRSNELVQESGNIQTIYK
jgi:hypothetical protein